MKWLIYALLLVNLAVGLWHYRFKEADSPVTVAPAEDALRLVLVKEFLAQQDAAPAQIAVSEEANTARCYTLGPFKSRDDAGAVAEQLTAQGIPVTPRLNRDSSRQGFWVLLPPAQTRQLARESIAELKSNGIKDYFLVVTGEQTNAVSLGVFSQPELAQRRHDAIAKLGFTPKIQAVDLPLREYWLDWPLESTLSTELLDKLRKQHSGIGQAERGCPPS